MSNFEKVIELLANEYTRAICRMNEVSCSAEWLYESGKRDGIGEILRMVERIGANEQQREG